MNQQNTPKKYRNKNQKREFSETARFQIAIMAYRGHSVKEIAEVYQRYEPSVRYQLDKMKKNGEYDKFLKRYFKNQPSEVSGVKKIIK